jgi:DNA replication protein DnaC
LENETKVLSASLLICGFAIGRFCDSGDLRSDDSTIRRFHDQTIGSFPPFYTVLHNPPPLSTGCAQRGNGFELRRRPVRVQSLVKTIMKTAAEVCPLCAGSGWKPVPGAPERGVTRCDCQLQARGGAMIAAARIPKRYEHCELSNFTTDFPGADRSIALAQISASRFVQEFNSRDGAGLLLVGGIGTGKTHLAVGILKELIAARGSACLFCDYRELLKQIQNSYNDSVKATELQVLRPVFEAEVLLLDELGAVKPSEWVWDTVSLILNTRYNDNRTTIITTNFADEPAASVARPPSLSPARAAAREETLGDRIGERMRSRLHEMCRIVKMDGPDFRQKFKSASFG